MGLSCMKIIIIVVVVVVVEHYCYYYMENCFEFEFLFLCDFKFSSNLGWLIHVYSVICKKLSEPISVLMKFEAGTRRSKLEASRLQFF